MSGYEPAGIKNIYELFAGTTTSDGNVGATTLVCSELIGTNDYLSGQTVLITSGSAQLESKEISSFASGTGTITVSSAFSVQILSGITFSILVISHSLGSGSATLANQTTLLTRLSAARAGYLDNINQAGLLQVTSTRTGYLDFLGRVVTTTIDLNQAAATYDLLTGSIQDVIVEKLIFRTPDSAAGGSLTSISIQTNDTTPQIFISSTMGAVANLTAQAQLANDYSVVIASGKKIQLTITGGAHGSAYSCTVYVVYRAVVAGGILS